MPNAPYNNYSKQVDNLDSQNREMLSYPVVEEKHMQNKVITAFSILTNSVKLLVSNLKQVFIGWLIFFLCFVFLCTVMVIIGRDIFPCSMVYIPANIEITPFVNMVIFNFIFFTITGCFIFGFITFLSNQFTNRISNFRIIFSGFKRIPAIFTLVGFTIIPLSLLYAVLHQSIWGTFYFFGSSLLDLPRRFVRIHSINNSICVNLRIIYYSMIAIALLYFIKFILVPNLIILHKIKIFKAIKKSFKTIKKGLYWSLFLVCLIFVLLFIGFLFLNYELEYLIFDSRSKILNLLRILILIMVTQVLFIWFCGSLAYFSNRFFPCILRTKPFAIPIRKFNQDEFGDSHTVYPSNSNIVNPSNSDKIYPPNNVLTVPPPRYFGEKGNAKMIDATNIADTFADKSTNPDATKIPDTNSEKSANSETSSIGKLENSDT